MKHEFKTGDTVTIGQYGTVQWVLMSKAGRNTFVCRSLSSGKIYPHSTVSMTLVKTESKDRSELYKLLPRVSDWGDGMILITIDFNGLIKSWTHKPVNDNPYFIGGWCFSGTSGEQLKAHTDVNLPPSINWKDTLVSREEMEAWEKSQDPTEDELNMPIEDYYMKKLNESDPESYEIDWSKLDPKATHHVFNSRGMAYQLINGRLDTIVSISHNQEWTYNEAYNCYWSKSPLTLPPGADWKKSLRVNPNLNLPSQDNHICLQHPDKAPYYVDKTETPQAKVERLKSELKEAEAELDRVTPVPIEDVMRNNLNNRSFRFNNDVYFMSKHDEGEITSLTFFKK